jgi:hypothetical protein
LEEAVYEFHKTPTIFLSTIDRQPKDRLMKRLDFGGD